MNVLEEIARETHTCNKCELNKPHYGLTVPGIGPSKKIVPIDICLVAESPGQIESDPKLYPDQSYGKPLVGPAGSHLQDILYKLGFNKYNIFATNVLKHRPPRNRPPQPNEKKACMPFLYRQLEHLRPRVIIALGKHASEVLRELGQSTPIEEGLSHRGKHFVYRGDGWYTRVLSTYHPSYACLRRPEVRPILVDDLKCVLSYLEGVGNDTRNSIDY